MHRSLYRYILAHSRRQQIGLAGLTLILALLQPVPLELQRRALDDAVANSDLDLLTLLCGLYLVAIFGAAAVKFGVRLWRDYISAHVTRSLRDDTYRNIYTEHCPPQYRKDDGDSVDDGAVVSILSNEVEKLGGFAGDAISAPLLQAGTLIAVLGYMLAVEPVIAAIAIGLYLPQFVIVPIAQARMNRLAKAKAEETRDLGDFMVDEPDDSLFNHDPPDKFNSMSDRIRDLRKSFVLTKHTMKTINNLLIALGPFGVIAYGGYLAIQGEVQVGVIVAFISGLERIGDPIRDLIGSYRGIADARMRYGLLRDSFEGGEVSGPGS
ncbi:ABC transporter ATP-binding protein [uncultured Tateyamaria sp.]|uniref:ABC transporter ATP-binding protein n=1 Tax=uncultured Tateyamaria sp. TaxID=455651 RepID=UPI002634F58B|nr:ABC transporter ATP-binding protein [uncultured Tateyamaria sp.]